MKKISSFLLSVLPLLTFLLTFIPLIAFFCVPPSNLTLIFGIITILLPIVSLILTFVVIPIYTVHATKCERLRQSSRGIWITLFIVLGFFVFPVYWFLYIRTE